MAELYSATLNPRGPNYEKLREIFGSQNVPLKSPYSHLAQLGPEKGVEVYMLDLRALTLGQRAQLLMVVSAKFNVPTDVIEAEMEAKGFPIRAVDVIVSISMRAVM